MNLDHQPTLDKILENNAGLDIAGVKRVLILHEEPLTNIGDWCIRFDKLKYVHTLLANATITINFTAAGTAKLTAALLKHNPHLHAVTVMKWQDIEFEAYDFIIAISLHEEAVLAYLHDRYGAAIQDARYKVCVYSMSRLMLKFDSGTTPVFPMSQELIRHFEASRTPAALFVTREEQQWADEWLRKKGLKEHEQLYIILDSTTRRDKLLNMEVYAEFLTALLEQDNVKVLIYDETSMGKQEFYEAFLGEEYMDKLIFSESLTLREDICLLASTCTRMVFGPCTGLMHCASGIYNHYVAQGLGREDVPVLITYTGKYLPDEKHVYLWWENTPLVNVLVLRNRDGKKTLLLMDDLNDEQKITNDGLPCSEYTADMLTAFVNRKLGEKAAMKIQEQAV
ncbi:hypothetical protein [uncultured Chitinophaga sp.]|jgi:hypothetical protein|uniref:glycosyltransferase family 9 protein n=1 Tax=uncultured Chitinophaga sp. TaxID=339340 RepID=UPI002637F585|nr:hypothetical protein [uncultured Chitinophaga sp.]